ncbi:hypothetical protein HZB93_02100 [Candidatus Falkowbacteria bacterium]|nr:hypothetical protein [Candidatus Falkowbacteria bacterium]
MKYKVLKPIAWSGRREKGEVLEMSPDEAENIGAEFLAPCEDESAVSEPKTPDEITGEYKKNEPSASEEEATESEPVTTGEEKVEDKSAVKPRRGKGKNKK